MRRSWLLVAGVWGVAGCPGGRPDPFEPRPLPEDAAVFADPGEPAPLMQARFADDFERGREVLLRSFGTHEGLGPTFNADSCGSCHQVPVAAGSAPRYRDFFLIRTERSDGVLVDAGTNGKSPVLNLYATLDAGLHIPPPHGVVVHARRNAPSGLGLGWLQFIPDDVILENEDVDDADGDGISGKANYEQGRVGRFGVKSQASSIESFNRGAAFNQMGITTDPLFSSFPEEPDAMAGTRKGLMRTLFDGLVPRAHAQVAAPAEPTVDEDGVPDPEMTSDDQYALLVYSMYVGAPEMRALGASADRGADLFREIGCVSCHVPRLESTVGPIRAYSDLLVHDMGEALGDGLQVGLAGPTEFRTAPLWGVGLHPPFLHDGRADTLDEAIQLHGGEAAASRDAYAALADDERADLLAFLDALGPHDPDGQVLARPEVEAPGHGEPGGPDVQLSPDEEMLWLAGRSLFDRNKVGADGLGSHWFNADSCRACHQDPVLGGAGGIDVSVIRYGRRDLTTGAFSALDGAVHPRAIVPGALPHVMPDDANVVELRQSPSLLGAGLLDRLADEVILANADPEDLDDDGIAGRARELDGGRIGRFGWKAQIPTLHDFVYDALFQEIGLTADPQASPFAVATDGDAHPDPEIDVSVADEITFFVSHLAPPPPGTPGPAAARGEAVFAEVGCDGCHVPSLGGVPAYTDLLLHEIVDDEQRCVDQDPGASATAFRTPPLWGVSRTAPYLHDGRAPTLRDAILGHEGTATASRQAFLAASDADQAALLDFLSGL